ncbi:MAG: hypothetical protein WCP40_07135 [Opitutae bacterium]|jgi:hypothetical protein
MQHNFALPLWSLVDQRKVELGKSDMRGLAKELGRWLNHNFDINHKGTAIEEPTDPNEPGEPMLIVAGVEEPKWPAMIALAQSKKSKLFIVLVNESGQFTLKELKLPEV